MDTLWTRFSENYCVILSNNGDLTGSDSLVIFCQVEFVPYNIECEDNVEDCSLVSASQDSLNMFKEGILTDFIIEISFFKYLSNGIGDETINTHRFILAKSSIVFQRMFEQMGMSEAQNGKIKIVDFSPECFRIMLETFYTGKIEKNTLEKHSEDLFAIAHKYEVKGLMQVCETSMASNIDASNFVKRCHYAELYHLTKLAKACVKFLSANKETFLVSKEWNEFKVNNKDLAIRLLESSALDKEKQIDRSNVGTVFDCSRCGQRNAFAAPSWGTRTALSLQPH
uniref:BTB domain-containing protein n=1 Tax=Meloidogyne hapla TaxID=6305 RepID=A0A1I8B6L3_MELHA